MKPVLATLAIILLSSLAWGQNLSSDALILVHPSKHYHTSIETISSTNQWVEKFSSVKKTVVALAQEDIQKDPLWYTYRDLPFITYSVYSRMGEHQLSPVSATSFYKVTLVGGYHSACLGQAVSLFIAKFIESPELNEIEIVLPMKSIFTGFYRKDGKLLPSIEFESYADSSLDGLNLYQATKDLNTQEWLSFIQESLRWAVFKRGPVVRSDLSKVAFHIEKNNSVIFMTPQSGFKKTIRFHYID